MSGSVRVMHLLESGGLYGAESVVLNLSERMQAAGEFAPVIGCIVQRPNETSALYDEAQRRGLAAEKVVLRNFGLAWDIPLAVRRLRSLGIGIIHSHGYKASVFGSAIHWLAAIPITATCHLWFIGPGSPIRMKFMVAMELRLYRRFRVVVAVSDDIQQILVRAGVSAERVRVIPNGIPLAATPLDPAARQALRATLGAGDGDFLVMNAGRLVEQKDHATLLRAIGMLGDQPRPTRCVVAGEGELHGRLKALIEDHGWQDRISLLGFRSDVGAILQVADAFALPSLDEGMPMILLETAAAGIPIVATAVGDIPKLIRDGRTGLVVPKSDPAALAAALARLRDDGDLAAGLGAAARDQVFREHSSDTMYTRYAEVYRQHVR
jgi:glycosyltransferase involved in cell wall biosynthesis